MLDLYTGKLSLPEGAQSSRARKANLDDKLLASNAASMLRFEQLTDCQHNTAPGRVLPPMGPMKVHGLSCRPPPTYYESASKECFTHLE